MKFARITVNLASLQVFNAVGCFGGHQLNIYSKVLAKTVCQLDVVALVVAVFVDVAEGALVTEYADGDLAAVLDLVKSAVICARGIAVAGAAVSKAPARAKAATSTATSFQVRFVWVMSFSLLLPSLACEGFFD